MVKTARVHGDGRTWLWDYNAYQDRMGLPEPDFESIRKYRKREEYKGKRPKNNHEQAP